MKPYIERKVADNKFVRSFSIDTVDSELEWHRDRKDRTVYVVEGSGWKFQKDNHLPESIKPGDIFTIPANTFHRVIKGESELIVEITEK